MKNQSQQRIRLQKDIPMHHNIRKEDEKWKMNQMITSNSSRAETGKR